MQRSLYVFSIIEQIVHVQKCKLNLLHSVIEYIATLVFINQLYWQQMFEIGKYVLCKTHH